MVKINVNISDPFETIPKRKNFIFHLPKILVKKQFQRCNDILYILLDVFILSPYHFPYAFASFNLNKFER